MRWKHGARPELLVVALARWRRDPIHWGGHRPCPDRRAWAMAAYYNRARVSSPAQWIQAGHAHRSAEIGTKSRSVSPRRFDEGTSKGLCGLG